MARKLRYLILLFLLAAALPAAGQSIADLNEQIRKAEKDIRVHTELINKVIKDQKVSQSQLKLTQSLIRSRRSMISSLEKQIDLIQGDIDGKSKTLETLDRQMAALKKEYAAMVRAAYTNYKLNNFLLFMFASNDFNDATKRVSFMKRYNRMREKKATEIRELADNIGVELNELDNRRAELDKTREARGSELTSLGKDESQYKRSLATLTDKERKLSKEIKAKQKELADAQKKLAEIIAAEARKNKNEKRTAAENKYIAELSGKFDQNMGKLPYPVSNGVIIDRYGPHPHPTQKNLVINNKGVNIAGGGGDSVTSVFEGNVTKVFAIPGLNNCVMVRHGDYITLYANLESVSVRVGDKVTLNQRIGRISNSANNDDNFLHFEIWKETTNLNPERWLR